MPLFISPEVKDAHRMYTDAVRYNRTAQLEPWVLAGEQEYRAWDKARRGSKTPAGQSKATGRLYKDNIIDAIAVELVAAGRTDISLTRDEKLLVADRLRGRGYTTEEIGLILGCTERNAERLVVDAKKRVPEIRREAEAGLLDVSPDFSAL